MEMDLLSLVLILKPLCGQKSAISDQQSANSSQPSALSNPQSAILDPQSAIPPPPSSIPDPQSSIRDPQSPPPLWWGRATHSLLLNVIRQKNDILAAQLHDTEGGLRPFTVSTLMGRFPHGELNPQGTYDLRLTAFSDEVTAPLFEASQIGGPLATGAHVELDYLPFVILTALPNPQSSIENPKSAIKNPQSPHPWAEATTYQDLSAPYLLAQRAAERRVSLEFTSPTTFKSGGMHIPVPLPELVFGSLLEKWNAFAPIAFPPETKRYAAECLAISRYKLESRSVGVKGQALRMGGIGQVTYTTLNYDRYWMSLIQVLAEFALFAGVGAGTTMGLGQCRKISDV